VDLPVVFGRFVGVGIMQASVAEDNGPAERRAEADDPAVAAPSPGNDGDRSGRAQVENDQRPVGGRLPGRRICEHVAGRESRRSALGRDQRHKCAPGR
jgi:hypothetical protein